MCTCSSPCIRISGKRQSKSISGLEKQWTAKSRCQNRIRGGLVRNALLNILVMPTSCIHSIKALCTFKIFMHYLSVQANTTIFVSPANISAHSYYYTSCNWHNKCRNMIGLENSRKLKTIRKIRTTVASMHTRASAHLPIVLHCYDVINFLGRKVAQIENNGLGRWLNANPHGQSVIRIFRILHVFLQTCISQHCSVQYYAVLFQLSVHFCIINNLKNCPISFGEMWDLFNPEKKFVIWGYL